jgi:nitrite reductase (NADH) small subunit
LETLADGPDMKRARDVRESAELMHTRPLCSLWAIVNSASKYEVEEMNDWIEIAALEDIPRLGARVIRTDTMDVAVFRTGDDQVFALRDACPHKGGPLSQGIVHGGSVTCPLHNWKIDLASGEALGPDQGCTNVFATRVENGRVYLAFKTAEAVA